VQAESPEGVNNRARAALQTAKRLLERAPSWAVRAGHSIRAAPRCAWFRGRETARWRRGRPAVFTAPACSDGARPASMILVSLRAPSHLFLQNGFQRSVEKPTR